MTIRAILTDIEGAAGPSSFLTNTLIPYSQERMRSYIEEHAEDEEIEEALDEAGRLMGGFALEIDQADALLQRWIKQNRKTTPLRIIQGYIWKEGYEAGTFKAELYPDAAPSIESWKNAGVRVFTYSSSSEMAQKLWLSSAGDNVADLFEGFFDTRVGQKHEEESYKAIVQQLGLPAAEILVLSDNDDELDAAKTIGLATTRIAREPGVSSKHPIAPDFASLNFG